MTKDDRAFWIDNPYPLTIVADRYGGAYSGGNYVAFPLHFDEKTRACRAVIGTARRSGARLT